MNKKARPEGTKTGSLRWRLTAVSLVMLTTALVALDVAIYTGLRQRYYSELRTSLNAAAQHAYDVGWNKDLTPAVIARSLSAPNVVAVAYQQGKHPVIGKTEGFEPPLPEVLGPPATGEEALTRFLFEVDSNPRLIWKITSPFGPGSDTVLFVSSTTAAEAALERLLVAELIGTLIVLGAAVLLVGLSVKLTLRPLDQMVSVASRISAGDIRQRLRPTKTSTELGRLAAAFDAMLDSLADSLVSEREAREQAARSEKRMRDFLSDASHELRTPIAGLQWSAEALLRQEHGREERERLVFQIAKQARRATRLIGDLLSLARLDQGVALERESFDLVDLLKDEIERIRGLEPRMELKLSGAKTCELVADCERIRQVVANLLDNACKATAGNGRIDLVVSRRGGWAELSVEDSGSGVPESERERIFERFVRLDDSRRRATRSFGSGLGLAIARGIAEAHDGTLVCAPCSSGARFVLTLPLAQTGEEHLAPPVRQVRA